MCVGIKSPGNVVCPTPFLRSMKPFWFYNTINIEIESVIQAAN